MSSIHVIPIEGIPEIEPGADLAALIVEACDEQFVSGDVLVVAQKAVSKAEGRLVPAAEREHHLLSESRAVLRRSGNMLISETRHGFVCANAGIDASNVPGDNIVLLPLDPDLSARRLRAGIENITGADVGVVVSDTFGRAWRLGQTNVAIGVAGLVPFVDHRGSRDAEGRELTATRICIADEIAGAAEMVMGKIDRVCAALVRGSPARPGRGAAAEIVRPPGEDLFR